MIQNPPALKTFTQEQITQFLEAVANGHPDDLALSLADISQSDLSDLMSTITPAVYQEAKLASKLPLAKVRERMNRVMLSANDPDDPMNPELALDILERRDPQQWGKHQTLTIKPPEPAIDPDEQARLDKLFGLPTSTPQFIEGEVVGTTPPTLITDTQKDAHSA